MKYLKLVFISLILFSFSYTAAAQQKNIYPGFHDEITSRIKADSASKLFIPFIIIKGNRHTRNYIILREMLLKTGDSIIAADLFDLVEQSRRLVFNTNLFSEVEIIPVLFSASEVSFQINVVEKWYIYPTPQFKLVDRNLNEWLVTYNADLNRAIYGAKFTHYNLSGRGDQLRIYLLNGYARAFSLSYNAPYSNSKLTEGFSFGGGYTQSREFAYKTNYENALLQYKKAGFVKNNLLINSSYQIRRGYYRRHVFSLAYNYINADDSVVNPAYNPNYLNSTSSSVGFLDFSYSFLYSNIDNINYPLTGRIISASISKRGLGFSGGVNMLTLNGTYSKYYTHKKNWYSSVQFLTIIKAPFRQAYINQKALGYGELYLRGLEYYVIDGAAAAIAKYTLKKKLISFNIPFPFNIKAVPKIPFALYAKTFADVGYGYNKHEFDTKLNNRMLYTGGFGLDILSLYGINLKLEYSFNQLGENGLFLHAKSGF